MDLNEFPSIFQKVQHSHSRQQETTSNLLRIYLNCKLRFNNSWPLEGAMNITLWWNVRGHPENVWFYAIFSNYWWFQTKWFTGLLKLNVQLYKKQPIRVGGCMHACVSVCVLHFQLLSGACSPPHLRLAVHGHDLAHVMDETGEMKPVLVRVLLSDSLCRLEGVVDVGQVSLQEKN